MELVDKTVEITIYGLLGIRETEVGGVQGCRLFIK